MRTIEDAPPPLPQTDDDGGGSKCLIEDVEVIGSSTDAAQPAICTVTEPGRRDSHPRQVELVCITCPVVAIVKQPGIWRPARLRYAHRGACPFHPEKVT